MQSIVFENLPAGKYEIEIEITDKTVHASNGDNRWNSCWLIVEKWIESRGEPIEAANPARVQWLAIETDEEA